MPLFKLNVEAAERYLTSIPLLSLEEDIVRLLSTQNPRSADWSVEKQPHLLTSGSGELVAGDEGLHRESFLANETPDKSSVSVSRLPLDVEGAERFLNSLAVRAEEWAIGSLLGLGVAPQETSQQQSRTVVGGWRNRSDLDRLVPGLIRKGLIGGRIEMLTRETCTYVCSIRPLQRAVVAAEPQATARDGAAETAEVSLSSRAFGKLEGLWQTSEPTSTPSRSRCRPSWLCNRRHSNAMQVKGISYAEYLVPTVGGTYDPDFLDNQSLRQGKNHTVLRLEAYQVSVIPFVRPRRLKEELNDQFRCSHPQIHPSMTLSKLRNLLKDLRDISVTLPDLDVACVAIAWVYFEKLVLMDRVRKASRKLMAGACLVLAYKFHQRADSVMTRRLASEIRKMDRKDRLHLEDIHDAELKVFVWLEFSLHVHRFEVVPHLSRILKDLGLTFSEYYAGGEAGLPPSHFGQERRELRLLDDDAAELSSEAWPGR